jgi:hypothetical protein
MMLLGLVARLFDRHRRRPQNIDTFTYFDSVAPLTPEIGFSLAQSNS